MDDYQPHFRSSVQPLSLFFPHKTLSPPQSIQHISSIQLASPGPYSRLLPKPYLAQTQTASPNCTSQKKIIKRELKEHNTRCLGNKAFVQYWAPLGSPSMKQEFPNPLAGSAQIRVLGKGPSQSRDTAMGYEAWNPSLKFRSSKRGIWRCILAGSSHWLRFSLH